MASVLPGFRPVKHLSGAPYNGQFNRYMVSASETGAINIGDLVVLSDSNALVDTAGFGVYPAVERAGSGTSAVIVGAVVGFEPDYSNLNAGMFRAASTRRVVFVADSPDLIFAAPQDGVGGVIAAASVGLNAAVALGSAATTAPWASAMSVDSSTVATTNTLPVTVVGILASPDNDETSTARPAEVLVRINTHQYANGATGV
jgi:hypothetical protein